MFSHHPSERLHRTICLGFRGKKVYLCARCTGTFSSLIAVLVAYFIGLRFPLWLYLPIISVLPITAAIDWLTQSCKLRESRNSIRAGTGLLLGIAEAYFLLLVINGMVNMFLVAMSIIGLYAISIYLVALKTKCLDSYLDDIMRGYQ
jgi:uncharacterized membrane protein